MTSRTADYSQDPEQLAAQLPREIMPPRDLWPDIEAALGNKKSKAGTAAGAGSRRWLQVAAIAVLIIGSSLTTRWLMDDAVTVDQTLVVGGALSGSQLGEPEMLVIDLLPAEAREAVISSLAVVRLAREEIEKELRKEPNNARLHDLLRFTYEQEADLLNDATWATITSSMRSTT